MYQQLVRMGQSVARAARELVEELWGKPRRYAIAPPRRARPWLEGMEERAVPATLIWKPTVAGNLATDRLNWVDEATGMAPAQAPRSNDNVVFDGDYAVGSNADCTWDVAGLWTICSNFTVKDGYSADITIQNSGWGTMGTTTLAGNLTIDTSNTAFDLHLGDSDTLLVSGNFTWDQVGDIDFEDGNAKALISVLGDTVITQTGTIGLGANLTMQGSNNLINSGSAVARQLELANGAVITNTGTTEIRNSWISTLGLDPNKEKSYFYNTGTVNLLVNNTDTRLSMTFVNDNGGSVGVSKVGGIFVHKEGLPPFRSKAPHHTP